MRMNLSFLLSFFLLLSFPNAVSSHPGGLDAKGCHTDARTGKRHCHKKSPEAKKAEEFSGKVVAIKDGDTVEVLREGKAVRIRLADVDCPEKRQPYGQKAKQFSSSLAFNKEVAVKVRDTDRYGRLVAELVLPDGRSLNRELVKEGLAWWYRQYSKDESYGKLEDAARKAKRGLWAEGLPVAPWEFRRKGGV